MAAQMQEIAEANRDIERSKIEVQLKMFSEQMEYQREKDSRAYENAKIANDNARLAIMKQGEMVSCLAQLPNVLSKGLSMSSEKGHGPASEISHQNYQGSSTPFYPCQTTSAFFGGYGFPTAGVAHASNAAISTTHVTIVHGVTVSAAQAESSSEQAQSKFLSL